MKRVGIFGGSFNPVHHGHLLVARDAFEKLKLDELIFVPCGQSAYGKKLLPGPLRLKLLRGSLRGIPGYRVSDLEIRNPGISRSVDTLRALKEPGIRHYLLIGADQVAKFPKWKEASKIPGLAQICVLARPGARESPAIQRKFRMRHLDSVHVGISSSEIRLRLRKKLPVDWLLPVYALKQFGRRQA
jgi:nicotinate-nucleotide adenylyltransferase